MAPSTARSLRASFRLGALAPPRAPRPDRPMQVVPRCPGIWMRDCLGDAVSLAANRAEARRSPITSGRRPPGSSHHRAARPGWWPATTAGHLGRGTTITRTREAVPSSWVQQGARDAHKPSDQSPNVSLSVDRFTSNSTYYFREQRTPQPGRKLPRAGRPEVLEL
jgi:hypothetical protein